MEPWTRHGECNGCGACCQVLIQPVTLRVTLPALERDYLTARGLTPDDQGRAVVTGALVSPCPQLTAENRCVLHESGAKPRYCRDYPTAPEQIAPHPCSYWFTRDGEAWGGQASPYPIRTRLVEEVGRV